MNRLSLTAIALCSTMVLASCSVFSQKKTEDTPAPQAEAKQTATVTPTAEQQAAATEALQNADNSAVPTGDTMSLPTAPITPVPAVIQSDTPTYQPATGIPGRSGLRMGHFAPPEEAASTGDNAAPAPNAAELRGLRSPSLPKNLPLDVNGQSKKN